jgi:hypothetical protein
MPLHLALASLHDVQSIFDKTYLVLTGSKKISKRDRELFQLRTFDIKHGSLESDLQIILESSQYVIPVIASIRPSDIWEHTKQGFEFLRFVYGLAAKGQTPMYEARDNGTINVYNGDNIKVYNDPVVKIGKMAVPHWRSLNHKMKERKIDKYFVGSVEEAEIQLDHTARTIFDTPTHVEKEPTEIACDVYDFNKRSNAGKLSIDEGKPIPAGDYPFSVVGSQDKI